MNAQELKKNIGAKIKHFRRQKGLSQDKLAEIVNIEMKSLSRIESGHNYPQCENLVAIAHALGIAPWQLYFCDEKKDLKQMGDEIKRIMCSNEATIPALYQFLKLQKY